MNEDHQDDDILELTEDMASEEDGDATPEADAEPEPARPSKPPASPFTLLAKPRSEEERRESRPSHAPPPEAEPPEGGRPSFVPDPAKEQVIAAPIRNLQAETSPKPAPEPEESADEEPPAAEESPATEESEDDKARIASPEEESAAGEVETPEEETPQAADEPVQAEEVGEEPQEENEDPVDDEPLELQEELVVSEESDDDVRDSQVEHPFDFGTPEMVFDGTAPADRADAAGDEQDDVEDEDEDGVEEIGEHELQEERGGEDGGVDVEVDIPTEEIDLNEAEEVAPMKTMGESFLEEAASKKGVKRGARKRRRRGKKEWWSQIFDDDFLLLAPQYKKRDTIREVDLIQKGLAVPPGSLLLDLACGGGRHAVAMARKNYRVVGVDLSLSMLARAGELAQESDQKINFIHGDMRDLGFSKTFDAVYCLGTSLGYFDEATNLKVLEGVYSALKPGAPFLLELANRDFVIRDQPNMVWFEMEGAVCMEETDFNYINSRLYVSRQLILNNGERQAKHEYSVRLYSLHEIGQLLHAAGFAVTKVSGHYASSGAFFGPESPQLIIVAERRR